MKLALLILVGTLFATPVFAGRTPSPPFALSARIEQVWTKLEWPEKNGTKQFDGDVAVTLAPSFELRENIYLIGRVTYPIQSELPAYAVGVEFKVY